MKWDKSKVCHLVKSSIKIASMKLVDLDNIVGKKSCKTANTGLQSSTA